MKLYYKVIKLVILNFKYKKKEDYEKVGILETCRNLIKRADDNLYKAKEASRNKINY